MTSSETTLCKHLVKEHFGYIAADVAYFLSCNSWQSFRFIVKETKLNENQVKKALCVLIWHKLVKYRTHRQHVQYKANVQNTLNLICYPKIIYSAKALYGDIAELIIEEILQQGIALMSNTLNRVVERLQSSDKANEELIDKFHKVFKDLVQTHFLQREPDVQPCDDNKEAKRLIIPTLVPVQDDKLYQIPPLKHAGLKRQFSGDSIDEPQAKRMKGNQKMRNTIEDDGVYWSVNVDRFKMFFRDQAIVAAISKKHGTVCGEIVRAMLRISEATTSAYALKTQAVSASEINQFLPSGYAVKTEHVCQHLRLMCNNSDSIMELYDDRGSGGSYCVNLKNAILCLVNATILSYIEERFGSKCCRIFRLLMMKKHLEYKQVEQFAMIPAKEAREYLYEMFKENVLVMQEIPKTPDHAPSRTFYLYSVNVVRIAQTLLFNMYKSISNLVIRQNQVKQNNRRLLDKQDRIAAIKDSIPEGDKVQLEEIDQMLSMTERSQIEKYNHHTNKLRNAQLQCSETVYIIASYLKMTLRPPV